MGIVSALLAVGAIVLWASLALAADTSLPWGRWCKSRFPWPKPGCRCRPDWIVILAAVSLALTLVFVWLGNKNNEEFYANLATESGSIALTIVVIDRLYRKRAAKERKREIIDQMSSPVHDAALEAVRLARRNGWVGDGTLRFAFLAEANLRDADLIKADLYGAQIMRANLRGTWLTKAHLEGTDLMEADLRGAHLEGAHLEGAHLLGVQLQEAHLENAYLMGANLRGANLANAYLTGAHLEGACLQEAHLGTAHMENAYLMGAQLRNAHVIGVKLRGASYDNSTLWSEDSSWLMQKGMKNVDEVSLDL